MINVICKKCNKEKQRIPDGRYKSKASPRYRDEVGGIWNGKICPECKREADKLHKRTKRRVQV